MTKEDQPDTRALIQAAFGTEANDILMNNTTGRYLSDMIEELIASRVQQEREACAKVCEKRAMDTVPDDSALDQLYYAAADIRARAAAAMAG